MSLLVSFLRDRTKSEEIDINFDNVFFREDFQENLLSKRNKNDDFDDRKNDLNTLQLNRKLFHVYFVSSNVCDAKFIRSYFSCWQSDNLFNFLNFLDLLDNLNFLFVIDETRALFHFLRIFFCFLNVVLQNLRNDAILNTIFFLYRSFFSLFWSQDFWDEQLFLFVHSFLQNSSYKSWCLADFQDILNSDRTAARITSTLTYNSWFTNFVSSSFHW